MFDEFRKAYPTVKQPPAAQNKQNDLNAVNAEAIQTNRGTPIPKGRVHKDDYQGAWAEAGKQQAYR